MTTRALFVLFRITFGAFLTWHWVGLRPYMQELYAVGGLYPHRVEAPWPNVLHLLHGPQALAWFNLFAIVLSLAIAVGFQRRWSALLLCYLHGCVVSWNVLLSPPSDGYVGWLLLALVCMPSGEGKGLHRRREEWAGMPSLTYAALIVMGVTYTFSGLDKLESQLWRSGEALRLLYEGPLARTGFLTVQIRTLPDSFLHFLTWCAVCAEALFLPLLFWRPTRILMWSAMTLLHFGVLLTVSITNVSIAMLCFHLFVMPTLLANRTVKRNIFSGTSTDQSQVRAPATIIVP